jgi:ABC-type Fe3+ transport system permease subunit
MNPLLLPALISLVAVGLIVLCVGAGLVMQLSPSLARTGKSLVRCSYVSQCIWILVVWMPFVLAEVLGRFSNSKGVGLIGFLAGAPIGLLVGLACARRNRRGIWILGGIAFVLLGLGLWFTWQLSNELEPPKPRKPRPHAADVRAPSRGNPIEPRGT